MNESGIIPIEYKVLVLPEQVDEKTAGGLYLAQQTREKEEMAQQKGTLIAVSEGAFDDWPGHKPQVGDYVYFSRYAGAILEGKDGKKYRLILDKDLGAIMEADNE